MKIQIVIPLWKRPEVTKFCFEHLHALIEQCEHQIKVLCVISETEYIEVCEGNGFEWVMADNHPVGAKINSGIRCELQSEWDYLMMMNSDNVILPELINVNYKPMFDSQVKFFGISKVTYVNFGTEDAREIQYDFSILGIGKCIRRDVVEQAMNNGGLYRNDLSKCLDDTMMDNLMKLKVFPKVVKYNGMLAMDFKSEVNIWPWDKFKDKGKPVCYKAGYAEVS